MNFAKKQTKINIFDRKTTLAIYYSHPMYATMISPITPIMIIIWNNWRFSLYFSTFFIKIFHLSPSSFATRTFFWVFPLAVRTAMRPAAVHRPCRPTPKAFDLALTPFQHLSSLYQRPTEESTMKRCCKMSIKSTAITSSTCACVCWSRFCAAICWGVLHVGSHRKNWNTFLIPYMDIHQGINYLGPPTTSPSSPTAGAAGARLLGSVPGAALEVKRKCLLDLLCYAMWPWKLNAKGS